MRRWRLEARSWITLCCLGFFSSFQLPASSFAQTITLTPDACAAATAHVPDADVTYQPGVDAYGQPVAPADLPGQGGVMPWPQDLQIPLSLDLQNALGISNKLTGTDAHIGTITYQGGKFFFNGAPIGNEAQGALAAECRNSRPTDQRTSRPGKSNILRGE